MKIKFLKLFLVAILPASLLLTGCWTNPNHLLPATGEPAFAGGMVLVNSGTVKAQVASVDLPRRVVVLQFKDGTTTTNVIGPAAVNLDQVKAGDTVKADIGSEVAIFIVKNGSLPASSSGVLLHGAAKGAQPGGMMVATHDYSARVIVADRSYRILKLKYADGSIKTFKVPLPYTLDHVVVGDDVVVRVTDTMVLHVLPEQSFDF